MVRQVQVVMKGKKLYWIDIILIVIIFILGYRSGSAFEIICAVCAALFLCTQLRLFSGLKKDNAAQQKSCKSVGPFLIVPALGTIAGGVWIFYDLIE